MNRTWVFGLLLVAGAAVAPVLAFAQSADGVASGMGAAGAANSLLQQTLWKHKGSSARQPAPNAGTATSAPSAAAATPLPFADTIETPKPGIPYPAVPGIHYTVDVGSSFPNSNTGYKTTSLPGTFDAVLFAGPDPYTRLQVGFYELALYPVGFDTGTAPAYLLPSALGLGGTQRVICNALGPQLTMKIVPNPNVCNPYTGQANLNALANDATLQDRIFVASLSKLLYVSLPIEGGVPYPIVVTPDYIARKASIGGGDDVYLVWNPTNGTYQTDHLRTDETKGVLFTFPLAKSPKLFATYTIGPQWLVNANGLNQDNHAQLFQYMDIRYFANDKTTIFFQPSRLVDELPNQPYAIRTPTILGGFNRILAKPFFIQAFFGYGTPQNPPGGHTGRIGVVDVTCVHFPQCVSDPDPRTNTAVYYGGLKASFFHIQLGIGTPSVIPL